jgi:hypothetical protein
MQQLDFLGGGICPCMGTVSASVQMQVTMTANVRKTTRVTTRPYSLSRSNSMWEGPQCRSL